MGDSYHKNSEKYELKRRIYWSHLLESVHSYNLQIQANSEFIYQVTNSKDSIIGSIFQYSSILLVLVAFNYYLKIEHSLISFQYIIFSVMK